MTPTAFQSNDPLIIPSSSRLIKWDQGNLYRNIWQWNINPIAGETSSVYDAQGNIQTQYESYTCADFNLGVERAWSKTKGSGVTILISDNGADNSHPDLVNQIAGGVSYAKGVISGAITDIPWNSSVPFSCYHGTAVSSVASAECNNSFGMTGFAPEAKLFIIRYFNAVSEIPRMVNDAISQSVSVMNFSWGFSTDDIIAKHALIKAGENGIIVVCATMNSSGSLESLPQPDYPGAWQLPNVLVVSSCTMEDRPYSHAAYSPTLVHLYSPGRTVIVANEKTGSFSYTSGTSFATPTVAATLALIKSANPQFTVEQIIDRLLASVDRLPQYEGKCITGGRLNVGWAVNDPELTISPVNGAIMLNIKGACNSYVQVDYSTNLNTWSSMDTIQLNISGAASIPVPTNGSGFFKAKFVRPENEWLQAAKYTPSKPSLFTRLKLSIFPPKTKPESWEP